MSGGLSCPARFQSYEAQSFRRWSQESQDEQERPHFPRYLFLIIHSPFHTPRGGGGAGSGGGGGGAGSERRWCRSCSLRRRRR